MKPGKEIVFGVNPVLEKLRASPREITEILISEDSDRAAVRSIDRAATRLGLRIVSVSAELLDRLAAGQRHQGVLAKIESFHYLSFDDLLQQMSKEPVELILILDGITDPRNFGAILRTAEAVGLHHVVIPKHRSTEVTPVVVKASAGAAYHLNIVKATNLRRVIIELKRHGYWIVGLEASSQSSLYERMFPTPLAIILGSEGKGIRQINLRECDFVVSIPMLGKISSLNVAVAGAIFMYEVLRQRQTRPKSNEDRGGNA